MGFKDLKVLDSGLKAAEMLKEKKKPKQVKEKPVSTYKASLK